MHNLLDVTERLQRSLELSPKNMQDKKALKRVLTERLNEIVPPASREASPKSKAPTPGSRTAAKGQTSGLNN